MIIDLISYLFYFKECIEFLLCYGVVRIGTFDIEDLRLAFILIIRFFFNIYNLIFVNFKVNFGFSFM